MKIQPILLLAAVCAGTALYGCKPLKDKAIESSNDPKPVEMGYLPGARALPKAVVYKTNVPSTEYVPVNTTADGHTLISYPAPSDVSVKASMPLQLTDGWLLDRRGIGPNSRFTSYTYAEYSALKDTPAPSALISSINPAITITAMYVLPITPSQAASDTASCNRLIREGFPGCEQLLPPDMPVPENDLTGKKIILKK